MYQLYGQYLPHAHIHITLAVAAIDSCFVLIWNHQHGIVPGERCKSTPLTLKAPISTYKFSKLISTHYLKKFGREILFADQSFSRQLIVLLILTTFSLDYVLILLGED